VRVEPASASGHAAIEGAGEESWSLGPGGIGLIEQEPIPSPSGDSFLLGVICLRDTTTRTMAARRQRMVGVFARL
jgi:hypothetical protein